MAGGGVLQNAGYQLKVSGVSVWVSVPQPAGKVSSLFGRLKRMNFEHRTPNMERRILMTLRFVDFKTSEPQIFEG
jgi:hypothetical protein